MTYPYNLSFCALELN